MQLHYSSVVLTEKLLGMSKTIHPVHQKHRIRNKEMDNRRECTGQATKAPGHKPEYHAVPQPLT
jgi:hypothetical protein